MAEYYGYAERSADDYINWGQVSKNMSDMLVKENQIREEKKKALDDETAKLSDYISNNMPSGLHKGAKDAGLELANQAQNYMLMQTKLLKSGQLDPKDYVRNREKLKSGVNQSYDALKNYQERYKTITDDVNQGKSSIGRLLNAAYVQDIATFATNGFFVDPASGNVVLAKKDKKTVNGQEIYTMSSNPSDVTTPGVLNSTLLLDWQKFDAAGKTKAFVDSIGDKEYALREIGTRTKAGSITDILDPTSEKISTYTAEDKSVIATFKKAEDDAINAMLANDYDKASLLLDYMKSYGGNTFKTVYNDSKAAEKDPTNVNMVVDPKTNELVPQFTKVQEEMAKDWIRNSLRSQYDRKIQIKPYTDQYQDRQQRNMDVEGRKYQRDIDRQTEIGKNATLLQTAPTMQVANRALQNIISLAGGSFVPTKDGYLITNSDGFTREFKLDMNKEGFATSVGGFLLGPGGWDPKALKNGVKKAETGKLGPSSIRASELRKTQNPQWNAFVESEGYIGQGSADNTVTQINSNFNQFGIRAENDGGKVLLYGPGDTEGTPLNISDSKSANLTLQQFIKNKASNKLVEQSFAPSYETIPYSGGVQQTNQSNIGSKWN